MLKEEISGYLRDLGIVAVGSNFFLGDMPARALNPVAEIHETGGRAPQETLDDGITFENPSFQISVRGDNSAEGDQQARRLIGDIWKALANVANQSIDGVTYQNISARQSPAFIGFDDNNNRLYVANFDVAKEVS